MYIILFITFIFIGILIYILFRNKINDKNISVLITIICTLIIGNMVIYPSDSIQAALTGGKIFISSVFPSLFPFLVIVNIIIAYDGIHIYSKLLGKLICKPLKLPIQCSIVLIVSALCGYPMGAKYACELYEKGFIDFKTTERLLNIATNASPLFIIGALGTSMLHSQKAGYILLISNYISCIIMSLIIPSKSIKLCKNNMIKPYSYNVKKYEVKSFGIILKNSIEDSMNTSLSVSGFVILFSVLSSIIKSNAIISLAFSKLCIPLGMKKVILGLTLGTLEMTNGCHIISSCSIPMVYKLIITSFLISFSGFCIIFQVYSFTYKHKFSLGKYISRKIIQGIICSIICFIIIKVFPINNTIETSTFFIRSQFLISKDIFKILILMIFPVIAYNFFKLFHVS